MPYKTRRQNRYLKLLDCGFVGFEARALSRISPKVPYMLPLLKVRLAEYEKAIKWAKRRKLSEVEFNEQWLTHIKRRYVANGWKHKGDIWGVTVAFRMLKVAEKQWKYKYPSYDSPWEKRQRQWNDFLGKVERTYEKHQEGWIKQLEKSIEKAETPERKAQLEKQKRNLESGR